MQGELAVAACGTGGIHTVSLAGEPKVLNVQPTHGFAVDVKTRGDCVYVAESDGGLSIWQADADHKLRLLSRLQDRNQPIRQVVLTPDGKRAMLAAGQASFLVADVSDPAKPAIIFRDQEFGLLYGYQIAPGLVENRYGLCFWHVAGGFWYDLSPDATPKLSGDTYPHRLSSKNGFAVLPDGRRVLYTTGRRGYAILDRSERRPLDELPQYGVKGLSLSGKPTICGNRLYVADRFLGQVLVLDIADIERPRLLAQYQFGGNPCLVVEHNGQMLIPGGYDGLLIAPVPE
jgi:hypothetical protein